MPEKIQNYTVSDRIGTGGTGIVRRGRETETKTDVAVKSLNTDLVREPQVRKRLKEATKSLQSMPRQENLVRVLDVVESGDTMHIIMEYAPGRSLDNLLSKKSRPMPYDSAVQLVNQMLRGASSAHSKGFLHGNMKPSDIIIAGDNAVKITGFGIAPYLSNAALVRSAGRTGKLAYMAPEQVRGESVDERSDVYSLGIILYRMITGTMPFSVSDRDSESRLRQAVLQQAAPNITDTMPELNIPPHLANLIHRAIAKDRRERIPTTREFARLLQKVQPEVQQIIAATSNQASSTKTAVVGAAVATEAATGTAFESSNETTSSAAAQFPPPQTPPFAIAQPTAFTATEETAKTPTDEPQETPTVKERSGLGAFFGKSSAPTPAPESPTVFTAPTLAQSPMQIEVERRMQAMRAEQAQRAAEEASQQSAIELERLQSSSALSNEAHLVANPYSTQGNSASTTFSPETLKAQLTPTEQPIKPAAKNEEKKKRAVLPWLVMGAVALGGGIYYIALKNKGTESNSPTMQRELSNDEKERRYDSLLAKSEKNAEQDPNAQNGAPLESGTQAAQNVDTTNAFPAEANNPATSPNQATESAVPEKTSSSVDKNTAQNSPASTEKPRIPDSGEPAKTLEKNATPAPKSAESTTSPNSSTKNNPAKKRPTIASNGAAKQTAPDNSLAEATTKKSSQRKQTRDSESAPAKEISAASKAAITQKRTSRKNAASESMANETPTAKRTVEKTTASAVPNKTAPNATTSSNTPTTKTMPKSGSLAEANSESVVEREAARERIRQKYAGHLKNKNSKPSTLATNTPFSTSTDAPSGKATPDALRDMNKKAPRTNREDNYAPATNPIAESPNTVDPSATELANAACKAKSVEPFLILRGHVGTVRSVSFSPDGKTIASGSDDKTVKIWDAATGTILRSLRGHSGTVTSVFFSPDGKTLISSGKDKTVRVWDTATGEAIQRSPGVSCEGTPAAFSPDGKFLATSDNRNINISKTQR